MKERAYTKLYWGHNVMNTHSEVVKKGIWPFRKKINQMTCLGFGELEVGDNILLNMASKKIGIYRCTEVEFFREPSDMWKGKFELIGYKE